MRYIHVRAAYSPALLMSRLTLSLTYAWVKTEEREAAGQRMGGWERQK